MKKLLYASLGLLLFVGLTGAKGGCGGPGAPECNYNGKTYQQGDSFPSGDGCNTCSCQNGQVACTLMACQPPSCHYNNKDYKDGESFPSSDGCNTCSCLKGKVACTEKACQNTCGGIAGKTCPTGQFCNYGSHCGSGDQMGLCEATPSACTKDYKPVCGCNNQTYGNECVAHAAGISVLHTGECKTNPTTCIYEGKTYKDGESFPSSDGCNTCSCSAGKVVCTLKACQPKSCGGHVPPGVDNTCPTNQFCNYRLEDICGFADASGFCKDKPQSCTREYAPVCGCDGKTYGNECNANAAGTSVQYKGECKTTPTSCVHNGKTYKDGESFPAGDGCNTCSCSGGKVVCTKIACQSTCGGFTGKTCPTDAQYCHYEIKDMCGAADASGICKVRPQGCPTVYMPVCGCNGKTYGNSCEANAAGTSVASDGECKTPTTCTHNGKIYKDGESFPAGDGCNTCSCSGGMVRCTKMACTARCGGIAGLVCPAGQYCNYGSHCGSGDQMGVCAVKPQGCTMQYDPVCGCDGKTHGNACSAASAGVSVQYNGECKATPTTCVHNGQTYKDGESFPAGDGCTQAVIK